MTRHFKYIASENRYVLEDDGGADSAPNTPEYKRTFHQLSVLHTSEDLDVTLTRAYNLEDKLPINDDQLEVGANERGQHINDASGGHHVKDKEPEAGF